MAEVVDEYLRQSKEAGELLNPFDYLKMPILRAGFYPPGLHQAVQEVAGLRLKPRRRVTDDVGFEVSPPASDTDDRPRWPDADELIELIFGTYSVGPCASSSPRQILTARIDRHM
ncbi:MAG: hypothetical protein ACE5JI_19350 [Acidobacteriota bacterium]